MPPRSFPFELGLGIDIVHLPRIRKIILKSTPEPGRSLHQFIRRLFRQPEQKRFWQRFHSVDDALGSKLDEVVLHLGGRWAAKEAAIKAVHRRRLSFMDIEIRPHEDLQGDTGSAIFALILDPQTSPRPSDSSSMEYNIGAALDSVDEDVSYTHRKQTSPEPVELSRTESAPDGPETQLTTQDERSDPPGQVAKLSISHDGDYATAVCLAVQDPMVGDVGGEAGARML